ncbi:sodium/potassium/calcium exchanger Nckx30C [Planococcus citri]|uniref:sodium/potassium/calcium exchanger Nckx30C n=1 Tax=Planococcus citri TaxID=170843 RepID=UPI0031F8A6A7
MCNGGVRFLARFFVIFISAANLWLLIGYPVSVVSGVGESFDNEAASAAAGGRYSSCFATVKPSSVANDTNSTLGAASEAKKDPLFPDDIFTMDERRRGLVLIHVLGVLYTFFALAIVCDEFFVPALEVIIEKLNILPDVAGATFMAAGGSAPELFTSIMGVFVSFDDVGIGTIVGSAVFNILFVIGACAIFSGSVLALTWWPLFRDCTFYSIGLLTLIVFFRDNLIEWYEAMILFMLYIAYVTFMRWNHQVEMFVKRTILREKVTRVSSSDMLMPTHQNAAQTLHGTATLNDEIPASPALRTDRRESNTSTKFKHGLLQLMIHTIDPMHDGQVDEKATQLHAIASLRALLDATNPNQGAASVSAARRVTGAGPSSSTAMDIEMNGIPMSSTSKGENVVTKDGEEEESSDEPLDISWPGSTKRRILYVFTFPIIFPLWLTLPDPRSKRGRKYFVFTFIGSIGWIAAFSYLMVWWANIVGLTLYVPPEVMGLTFLAAGTSVPDLITSVIVAKKGCGDMAVSSSVGSNIFDITVGLPFPWMLYNAVYRCPVKVNSVGMVCSIATLFLMLLFVVVSIACFQWRMNHGLGYTMFALYVVFLLVSLLFEYHVVHCPV